MTDKNNIMASVIVLTYNQEQWIRQTLESITSQQSKYAFEVIIGEDYGTDGTRDICQQFENKYSNVHLAVQTHNLGVAGNFVNCVKQCNGKYIMCCGGDDFWHNPNKIQLQVDYMEQHPECVICHTDLNVLFVNNGHLVVEYNKCNGITPPEGRIQKYILSGKEHISAVTMCIRKDSFDKYVPMDKYMELKFPREDWPTLLILAAYGDINYIPVSTATYRRGQESISNTLDYDKIRKRSQLDKEMTEYLYSLFPDLGPFVDGWYFDANVYRLLLNAAYVNNDYKSAKSFAESLKRTNLGPNKASKMTKSWITFKIFRFWRRLKRK